MKKKFTILITAAFMLLTMMATTGEMWGQSDYSTDYTGNITLSTTGGTQATTCLVKINNTDYDGIKAGTSKNAGAVKITVPSGAKYLHLHLAAWNNETVTLAVTPTGYSGNIALTNNSGISNNSPFTFNGDPSTSDYYKVITFTSALTADTDLTFTATGGKRFVVWGVTSEEEGGGGDDPYITASNVNIAYDDTEGSIAYTLNNATGNVTATTEADWLTLGTATASAVPFTCSANEGEERTATVTLSFTGAEDKDVTVTQAAAPVVYTTIPDIFAAATTTETNVNVTFNDWVVSGVSTNGKNVYVTDGTNGLIIYYTSDMSSTFSAGNILSGENVSCTLKLYYGAAELLNVNAADLTITDGGTVTPADIEMADLAGVNTGALLHYDGLTCTVNNNKYYLTDGTTSLQLYNALFAFSNPVAGKVYNITGVYVQYNNTKEIMPRSADDIEAVNTEVADPVFSPEAGTYNEAQTVTMSCTTNGAAIHYTTDGTEPDGNSTQYTEPIPVSTATTFKAKAIKGDNASAVITATYHICSAENPYTVAQALAFHEYPTSTIWVHGIVSTAPTAAPNSDGQLTYYISDNGEATNQLQVYKGKGLNNAAFTAQDDIQVGDIVTITGTVKIYNTTTEFDAGNYLTSFERPVEPSITVANATVNVDAEGGEGTLTVTYENITTVVADIWFCNAAGTEDATYDWITASINNSTNNADYLVEPNDGNERTAYFKVWAYDDEMNEVYSNLVTVTQAEYVAPTPSIAVTPTMVEATAEGTDGTITVTLTAIDNNDIEVHWFEADGTTAATYNHDWIEANVDSNNDIAYVIEENTGDARSAYFKVYGMDSEANDVYSELVTINQAAGTTPPTPGQYDWVLTDLADLTANDVFVIVGTETGVEEDAYFALPNNGGTQNAPSAVSVTVSNNTLSGEIATTIQWNISGNSTDGYIFYPNGDTETWLYCNTSANSSSNNNIRVGSGDRKYFVLDDNDYIITNDNSVTRYLSVYNDQDWRGYIDTSHGAVPISFYKRVPASTEPSITLNQYTYNLNADGGDTELPVTTANLATSPQLAVVFYESDGTTTTTYDWISATINNAGNIAGHIDENEGAARTAYFKVSGLANDNTTTVYSDLVTINQAAATAPSIVFETTSMSFVAGGEQDRKLSFDYSGLGSTPTFTIYYYESNGTTAATAATYSWLTATIDANNKLNITVVANTGEARSAYLRVYGEKNANVHAESNLVTINQAEYVAPTYTVTYNANGGTGTMTDPNSPYTENAEVTLLENAFGAPEGKIWNSWLVQDANQTAIAVNEGKFNMPASNVTVTAQWVDDPSGPTYEWVLTALEDLTSSDVFVIVGNNGSNYAMTNNNGTTSAPSASAVTVANNKLSNAPDDNLKWNIEISNNGYTFYPNGVTNKWLYCTDANNGLRVGTGDNKVFAYEEVTTTDKEGYYLTITPASDKRYVCIYNNADWRSYKSSSIVKTDTKFYKRQVASTDPQLSANDVNIASDATEGEITYTLENAVPGGQLSAEITAGNEDNWLTLGTVGATVPFTCFANTEATERTATVTLTYTYNAKATVTATAVVTQAALVIDFATLPFEFDGGRADIENTVGLTQNGIDTDYGSSPKLKFNTTGDWMILKLNAAPVSLSYDIKGNSFSGGTFTVQTSANGTDYSDLATYTTLGDAVQSITHVDLDANVHYIKWIYTYKKTGNVALGNIHATEHYDTYGDLTFDSGLDLTATSESLIVHEGSVVTISGDLINNSPDNLVIEDGGQLIYTGTEPVAATIKRSIADPAKDGDVWYTISSPVNNVTSASVKNLISSTDVGFTYDLYLYDEPTHYWINQKAESNQFTNLTNGRGYLYWNTGSDLEFAGTLNTTDVAYQLTYSESAGQLKGFNLIGNPFSHNIYKGAGAAIDSDKLANGYYTLSNDWAWQTNIFSQAIKPTQGILVQATEAFELTIVNSATPATAEKKKASFIEIVAGNKEYSDVAYVVFGKGIGLNKIDHINTEIPEVYFWQNNERFAVASLNEDVKEIALNFQAATEGSYDIKVDFDGDFNYLHLIDNMTGANVDLLQTPSYTFDANVTDYASRFRLVFSANHGNDYDEEIDNEFGFIDASGNLNILNNAGEATLQLVDVTGRIISSETFSGSYSKAVNASAGVYMLRLINGNNVKTQKIVIR